MTSPFDNTKQKYPHHQLPRQAFCAVCGKRVHPGQGIMVRLGVGGRVHKGYCFSEWTRQHSATKRETLYVSDVTVK